MQIKFKKNLIKKFQHPLFRNSFFGSSGFIFISLIGLIITPILVANFGVEQYGVYVLIISIVGYYGIFDFGLGQGLIKFISEYNSKGLYQKLNEAINSVFTVQLIIGVVLSSIVFIFAEKIINILNVSSLYYCDSVDALKIASIGFLFTILSSTFSSAIKGLERYGIITVIDSSFNLLLNILILIVVFFKYGIKEAVLVNVIVSFANLLVYAFLFKNHNKYYVFRIGYNSKIIKNFISFSVFIFLSRISSIFSKYVVRFIVSVMLGPTAVTYYVVPSKLTGAIGGVLSSAANAIYPFTSRLKAIGKVNEIKDAFIKASKIFTAISLPLALFIILFSKSILTIWMGEGFAEKSWIVLSIISLSGIIGSFSTLPNFTLLGLGNSKLIGLFSGITIILYLIFIPILTMKFGIIGTASGLLITSISVITLVLYKTTKVIDINVLNFFFIVYKNHLLPISFILLLVIPSFLLIKMTYIEKLIIGIIVIVIYYAYLLKKNILNF